MSYRFISWLEIDLGAIEGNVRRLRATAGTSLMAVVKANGYGHGGPAVARAAAAGGAEWLGAARMNEALDLRAAGLRLPILVLGPVAVAEVDQALAAEISLTVPSLELAQAYGDRAAALGARARVHFKIDSGMGRLGVLPDRAVEVAQAIHRHPGLHLEGVFTHLACADEASPLVTRAQLSVFAEIIEQLRQLDVRPTLIHAANSAATLYFPESRWNLVRTGIAMYGLQPSEQAPLPEGFRPALTWKAQLASCKELPPGHGVSYGHEYVTRGREVVGVVPVGYADGLRRSRPNEVLVGGARRPVIGRVCMDQCIVRLEEPLPLGTEVVLIGRQGSQSISAEEVASRWGTSNYEVVTGLCVRLARVYIEGG